MTGYTLLLVDDTPSGGICRPVHKGKDYQATGSRLFTFWYTNPEPSHIGQHCLHFTRSAIRRSPIQTPLETIRDALHDTLDRSSSLPEFWIGGIYSPEIITPGLRACLEMTVLTIHTIRLMTDASLRPKIHGGLGN